MKIIAQGAEAIITRKGNKVIKKRVRKGYRLPIIDSRIRKQRTKKEARLLEKASKLIPIPKILKIDENSREITLEFLNGKKLSDNLDKLNNNLSICKTIGQQIAKLHDNGIIHGDLTTSNMILVENSDKQFRNITPTSKDISQLTISSRKIVAKPDLKPSISEAKPSVFFIDFGLGFHSNRIEDKAVDIHLLKQALEAKHFKHWEVLFKEFIKGYNNSKVLEQLKKVESRGRYKEKY